MNYRILYYHDILQLIHERALFLDFATITDVIDNIIFL